MNFRFAPVIKRYAQVLLEICGDSSSLPAFQEDWKRLNVTLEKDPEGWRFLTSPLLSRSQKLMFMDQLGKEFKFCHLMQRFLNLLIYHRRLALLKDIMHCFFEKLEIKTGCYKVCLMVARPLSRQEEAQFENLFQKLNPQKALITSVVNPAILGGAVLRWGQFQLDASLATRLKLLHQQLQTES